MSELVTKEFLKAFGDKCKKIFKCQTKVATVSLYELYYYAIIKTDLPFGYVWSIHMDINGKGLDITNPNTGVLEYSGDIKFFCNMSNKYPPIGRGYSLVDNEVLGVGISSYEVSGSAEPNLQNLCFIVHFSKPVHLIAVDIFNYEGPLSTINITDILFVNSIDDLVYNHVLGSIPNMINESIGEIIRLLELEELKEFSIEIPSMDDSSIPGYSVKVPSEKNYIPKVNSSKWSDYLKKLCNIILLEGDLKLSEITFGGNNKTEVTIPPLEINNSVLGNAEGEWFGKVLVNSKGLVTAVEPKEPLQVATDTILGGIQIGYEENTIEKNYPVSIDENNKAYVHVPWNDTDTWNKVADSDNLGLIKIGYEQSGKNYPVELDLDNKAYVNVPWEDTTYNVATTSTLGMIKLGIDEVNTNNYPIRINGDGNAYVKVNDGSWIGSSYNESSGAYVTTDVLYGNVWKYHTITLLDGKDIVEELLLTINKSNKERYKVKEFVIRVRNEKASSVRIKVNGELGVLITNMFDPNIVSSGLDLPAGKTLELVLTFWNVNDVSFNGGFSV